MMLLLLAPVALKMAPATGLVGPGGSWNRGAPVRLSVSGAALVQGFRKAFDFGAGPAASLPYRKQTADKVGEGGHPDSADTFSRDNQEAVDCFAARMKPPLNEKENALVRRQVGQVSRMVYESDSRSKANEAIIEKTAVDNANKQTSSDINFKTGVVAVISVACSLLARMYVVNPAITLLQCASFSFLITIAEFVTAKVDYFKALRRGDKIARGDAY